MRGSTAFQASASREIFDIVRVVIGQRRRVSMVQLRQGGRSRIGEWMCREVRAGGREEFFDIGTTTEATP
jgi:hypothetical protein